MKDEAKAVRLFRNAAKRGAAEALRLSSFQASFTEKLLPELARECSTTAWHSCAAAAVSRSGSIAADSVVQWPFPCSHVGGLPGSSDMGTKVGSASCPVFNRCTSIRSWHAGSVVVTRLGHSLAHQQLLSCMMTSRVLVQHGRHG